MNVFIATVYVQYWFECTLPAAAPKLDLKLIENLIDYRNINKKMANELLRVFGRHLWYLSETLIGLAFFDETIDNKTKRLMIAALKKNGVENNFRKADISMNTVTVADLNIDRFVTSNTRFFFNSLFSKITGEINPLDFLEIDPSRWINKENYLRAKDVVNKMLIVNDVAERAVGLMTRFNGKVTNKETETQMVLQVTEHHQKKIPLPYNI